MATVYVPPPSAEEVMGMMARWVARLYGVRVSVKVESKDGEHNMVSDGRTFVAARYSNEENVQIADTDGTAGLGA